MQDLDGTDVTTADGTRVRRWERVPGDASEAVFFVHGATYGGRSAFAPADASWLDAVAERGRAAYTLDVRGYGESARPPELDAPPEAHRPVVRASTAARDVAAAFADVREAYETVHLVGYSWGTVICGVALEGGLVDADSLVQYAPVYHPPASHRERYDVGDPPRAYRRVTKTAARERWAAQRDADDVPEDAFEAFWDTLAESGQRVADDEILAPNGTLVDLDASVDDPVYDPGVIDAPTLVVRGSLDTASRRADALELYDAVGATHRGYAELAGGTHFLQLEPGRRALYDTVSGFHDRVPVAPSGDAAAR